MSAEQFSATARRAAAHAALGEPARLRIVDSLLTGDCAPSELAELLGMPSNLVAHHINALERAGLVTRRRSEGDARRTYVRIVPEALPRPDPLAVAAPERVLFVCTANSARSHLAAALWRRSSAIPSASAGTRPAGRIDPGTIDVAARHGLPLPRLRPRHLDDVAEDGDLVVTVCDLAHEELGRRSVLHWSIADPAATGTPSAFDSAFAEIAGRVSELARHLPAAS